MSGALWMAEVRSRPRAAALASVLTLLVVTPPVAAAASQPAVWRALCGAAFKLDRELTGWRFRTRPNHFSESR